MQQEATKLASILLSVVTTNNFASWDRFLRFGTRTFHAPARGATHVSLATLGNSHIKDEVVSTPYLPRARPKMPKRKTHDPLMQLASCVSTKIEEGDFIGAVRLCVSCMLLSMTSPTTPSFKSIQFCLLINAFHLCLTMNPPCFLSLKRK